MLSVYSESGLPCCSLGLSSASAPLQPFSLMSVGRLSPHTQNCLVELGVAPPSGHLSLEANLQFPGAIKTPFPSSQERGVSIAEDGLTSLAAAPDLDVN